MDSSSWCKDMDENTGKGKGKLESEKNLEKATKSGNKESIVKAYIELGDIYKNTHDTVNAERNYEKALPFAETDKKQQGKLLLNLAAINLEQLDYDKALEQGSEGIQIFKGLNNVKALIDTYKIVTKVYTRTKQTDKALTSVNQMCKAAGIKNEKEYEIARVYHSLKDYDNALKHFLLADDLGLEEALSANANNYIGRIYLKKMKPESAHEHLEKAYNNKELLKGLEYRFAVANMGTYYHQLNDLENARKFYKEAMDLFIADGSLAYINFFFNEIKRIDDHMAYEFAIKNPLGITWLMEINKQKSFQSIDPEFWQLLTNASTSWWQEYRDKKNSSLFQHWKIKQVNTNIVQKITSESILNFVLGANDLSVENLHEEEENLPPLWFVELPAKVNHGEKHLKIRLNNLIKRDQEYLGYPSGINGNDKLFTPVERIIITLRTQWLQEITIDHIFNPNTQAEWEAKRKTDGSVWLKDVHLMDLGEYTTSEDQLELNCRMDIYFDVKNKEPDIKTTNKKHVIPIYRKNRFQVLQKIRKSNENALTALIALTSILSSLYMLITGPNSVDIRDSLARSLSPNDLTLLMALGGGILVITAILLIYFLNKDIDGEKRKKTIQE